MKRFFRNRGTVDVVLIFFVAMAALAIFTAMFMPDGKSSPSSGIENRDGDDKPAVIIEFPKGFSNIAVKCYSGIAMFSSEGTDQVMVESYSDICNNDTVVDLSGNLADLDRQPE